MASHEARDNDTESESARHSDHDSGSEGEREDEAGGGAHGSQRDRDHDQRERRRHQNRIAQRNYRKKRQARLKELERKLAEARAIVPRFAPVPPVPAQTNPTPEQAVYTTVERDSLMARLESLERENAELKKHFASCPSLASHTRSEQDARFHPYHNQGYAPSYYPYSSVPGVPPAPFGVPSFSPHPHPVTFHPLPQSYPDYPYYGPMSLHPIQTLTQVPPLVAHVGIHAGVHYPFSEPPLTQLRRDLKSISDLSFRPELVDAYVDGVEALLAPMADSAKEMLLPKIFNAKNALLDAITEPEKRTRAIGTIDEARKRNTQYMQPVLAIANKASIPKTDPLSNKTLRSVNSQTSEEPDVDGKIAQFSKSVDTLILEPLKQVLSLQNRENEVNELVDSFKMIKIALKYGNGESPIAAMAKHGILFHRLLDACEGNQDDASRVQSLWDKGRQI